MRQRWQGQPELQAFLLKAVEGVRKKWFLRGFEAGQFIGDLTAAENFACEKTVIQKKYDKLCEEFEELQENYNDLFDDYYEE